MGFFFKNRLGPSKTRVVIIGAGEVGMQIADHLEAEEKEVVLIDSDPEALREISDALDVKTVLGQGDSPVTLTEAGIEGADVVLAVTDSDATNIIASLFANKLCPTAITVARIRNEDYTRGQEDLIHSVLGINTLINPEEEVVKAMERMLSVPGIMDYSEFAGGLVKMLSIQVAAGPMVNLQLKDFNSVVPEEIIVAAIERGNTIIVPSGEDKIEAGDVVFFVCLADNLRVLRRATDLYAEEAVRSVFVAGGGNTGLRLAQLLEKRGYNVKLADYNEERCAHLAEVLNSTVVLRGDATDQYFLLEESIGEMDAIVTVTGSDEVNVLVALLAKSLGVGHAIVRINKKEYQPLVEAVGLKYYINPRVAAVNSILPYIRKGNIKASFSFRGEEAEAVEVVAQKGSLLTSAPLSKLGLPRGMLVLAIVRGTNAIIPNGDKKIEPGDTVLVLANRRVMPKMEDFLAVS